MRINYKCHLSKTPDKSCIFTQMSRQGAKKGNILCQIVTHRIKDGNKKATDLTEKMTKCPEKR